MCSGVNISPCANKNLKPSSESGWLPHRWEEYFFAFCKECAKVHEYCWGTRIHKLIFSSRQHLVREHEQWEITRIQWSQDGLDKCNSSLIVSLTTWRNLFVYFKNSTVLVNLEHAVHQTKNYTCFQGLTAIAISSGLGPLLVHLHKNNESIVNRNNVWYFQ